MLRRDAPAVVAAGPNGAEALILQARPIGEPVAVSGPFVMNTNAEIDEAYRDFRCTGFGGWPRSNSDPVRSRSTPRFARHPKGRSEYVQRLAFDSAQLGVCELRLLFSTLLALTACSRPTSCWCLTLAQVRNASRYQQSEQYSLTLTAGEICRQLRARCVDLTATPARLSRLHQRHLNP